MLLPKIKREDPELVYGIYRNLHSAALGDGEAVELLTSADTPPTGYTFKAGVDVKQTADVSATVAGIAKGAIAQGEYGRIQIYGYHPNVKTTVAILAVDTVVTADAAGAVLAASVAALGDIVDQRFGVCIVTGAANRAGVFIKAMGTA